MTAAKMVDTSAAIEHAMGYKAELNAVYSYELSHIPSRFMINDGEVQIPAVVCGIHKLLYSNCTL